MTVRTRALLDGVAAAPELPGEYSVTWPAGRQLGEVARTVQRLRGPHFGPVSGSGHALQHLSATQTAQGYWKCS